MCLISLLSKNYLLNSFVKRNMASAVDKKCYNFRVLSIQSHVVHGYVGNKCATFPLQVLGFEVDNINSVQFSNHTHYDVIKGQILNEKDLNDVFEGLKGNNLLSKYTHLLTGYVGNDLFLRKIVDIVKQMREVNPNLIYVCDPVMGDNGRMYVPKSLLPIYRDEVIPLANITTPNQYEVELLTGKKIQSEADAWNALKWFHDRNVSTVALSSTNFGTDNLLTAFLSHKKNNHFEKYKLKIPILGEGLVFTGTGDLFAALFLAHSTLSSSIGQALEKTTATVYSVIKRTFDGIKDNYKIPDKIRCDEVELKLVQSKSDIENPKTDFIAEKL